jgi:hypothetical protein
MIGLFIMDMRHVYLMVQTIFNHYSYVILSIKGLMCTLRYLMAFLIIK